MLYTISTTGDHVVLTLTPDAGINSPNLYQTDFLLERAVSSSVSSLVFDLGQVSCLNSIGSWTIFQVVFKAQEHGKGVFLINVQPDLRSALMEYGVMTMAHVMDTNQELETAVRATRPSPRMTRSHTNEVGMSGINAEGF